MAVVLLVGILVLGFLIVALGVKLVCWAFGIKFIWSYVVGVFALAWLIRMLK